MRCSLLFVLSLNLLCAATVLADTPAPATQPAADAIIMTYDVGDLLRAHHDYPLPDTSASESYTQPQQQPAQSGGGGQGLFNGNAASAEAASANSGVASGITGEALIALIKQMIPQDDVSIAMLGDMLVVRASGDTHQKIQGMLNSMHSQKSESSAMVSARLYWVMLNPAELNSVFEKVKPSKDGGPAPMPELPDSLLDATHLYCQSQTMCFSGQTVHMIAGRSQSYISNLSPVVGSNTVGVAPEISKALSGATLQIKPQLQSDGKATVDLASLVNESTQPVKELTESNLVGKPTTAPNPALNSFAVESVNVLEQEFHTTVRISLGKKILIGGMTLEPAAKDQAGRQLFLAIQVDAVE